MYSYRTFQGRGYRFTKGLQQSYGNRGLIRMSVSSVGWDKAYSRLKAIPPNIKLTLKQASNKNARRVAEVARKYVPHGLETNNLYNSIEAVGVQDKGAAGIVSTVRANTPYAHFVEMDIHPSYKGNMNAAPVFGRRQGAPQGPHYMERAMADTLQESQATMYKAVTKGIKMALKMATTTKGLDFVNGKGAKVAAFVSSALDTGMTIGVPTEFGIAPLQSMELGGL